ncbi:MAG: hypothetical protein WAP35_05115 [Solirubrobacterales bacterium]
MPGATSRLALPYPVNGDAVDVAGDIQDLATAADNLVPYSQGVFASRPTSTGGSPGKQGRRYYATDQGIEYLDTGTSWIIGKITQAEIPNLAIDTARLADNAVTNAKVADNAIGSAEIINASVADGDLASPNNAAYKRLFSTTNYLTAQSSHRYLDEAGTAIAVPSIGSTPVKKIGLVAADIAVPGKTTKMLLRVTCCTGTTAPGVTITVGMQRVDSMISANFYMDPSGFVSGSTVAFASPAALNISAPTPSTEINLPADGLYAIGVLGSAAAAAAVELTVTVEYRNV